MTTIAKRAIDFMRAQGAECRCDDIGAAIEVSPDTVRVILFYLRHLGVVEAVGRDGRKRLWRLTGVEYSGPLRGAAPSQRPMLIDSWLTYMRDKRMIKKWPG